MYSLLKAYNQRDIEAWLAMLHPQFESYLYDTNKRLCKGKTQAEEIYTKRFRENPGLEMTLLDRITMDNVAVEHHRISGFDQAQTIRAISITTVEDGLIRRADFIRRPDLDAN